MESSSNESRTCSKIGDRLTSDVVVRISTQGGRDEEMYCHMHILAKKSEYCADWQSTNWPTCKTLEVNCEEHDFDHHMSLLCLFYLTFEETKTAICSFENALGILRVADMFQCPEVVSACVEYLEAVPWEGFEEEEILTTIPQMGSQAEQVLARLKPVKRSYLVKFCISAFRFATSSKASSMIGLKTATQEQLEYMLITDADAYLLTADDGIQTEAKQCVKGFSQRFSRFMDSLSDSVPEDKNILSFQGYLSDLSWASLIMAELGTSDDLVLTWVHYSSSILKVTADVCPDNLLHALQVKVLLTTANVLEAIRHRRVILTTPQRLEMVKLWLPFVRMLKHSVVSFIASDTNDRPPDGALLQSLVKVKDKHWNSLEKAFTSIILTLPSSGQTETLTEWFANEESIEYPDLTEAYDRWCRRFKAARKAYDGWKVLDYY